MKILDENRSLASAPVLKSWGQYNEFTDGTVKWFNDHYGFRDFLIRAKTQIDYSIFGISSRVYVGSDGWLFYRHVVDIHQPQIDLALRSKGDEVVEGIRQLAVNLDARGIKLLIMIAPMKNVYYSGHLPSYAAHLPSPRQVDLLAKKLMSIKELTFIDSVSIMRELSSKMAVFHKTDFHWNDPAAFEVAREVVNAVGKLEGRSNPVWIHKLEIEVKSNSGGEANFMPIFFRPTENSLFVKSNWIQPPFDYVQNKAPFEWIYDVKQPSGNELYPMTVLGDSFFDGMQRSGISIYFKKIYRARTNNTNLNELISNLPKDTRYFFIEFIETDWKVYAELAAESKIKNKTGSLK